MSTAGATLVSRRNVLKQSVGGAMVAALAAPACTPSVRMSNSPSNPVPHERLPGGLEVRGGRFVREGAPFFVSGMNFWGATTLARDAAGWDQVRRELDALQALGINVVRTMAMTEGPDTEPLRVVPSIQPRATSFEAAGMTGVLRVADELRRRGLYGIFALTNFWPWSGGMAQYLAWAGEGAIPYPPPVPGGSYEAYEEYTGRFYASAKAVAAYEAMIRAIVPQLRANPAVIWELANEPRGMSNVAGYRRWIDTAARLVKSLAPGQLVTTGSEGETASPWHAGLDVVEDHRSAAIDFVTCHLWAQNWGWVSADSLEADTPAALEKARRYVRDHASRAAQLGKPLLLEEFGYPRDGASCDPGAPTRLRDGYFARMYEHVASLAPTSTVAGIMPWAWSGAARPPRPGEYWRAGDPIVGDPPHEPQGWYGIYASDATTAVVREGSAQLLALARA